MKCSAPSDESAPLTSIRCHSSPLLCCGNNSEEGIDDDQDNVDGNLENDGFIFDGTIRQSLGYYMRLNANEVRTKSGMNDAELQKAYDLMTEKWEMTPPHLIVSVVGTATSISLDSKVLRVFKDLLCEISQTPGAWIITDGLNAGVSRLVGDALIDQRFRNLVGIPTESKITIEEMLRQAKSSLGNKYMDRVKSSKETKGPHLDPKHGYFLMYDVGAENSDLDDTGFRAAFEEHVAKKIKIPCVMIVLNGGTRTLRCIQKAVSSGHKVILVRGSGGVADDLVANMIKFEGRDQKNKIYQAKQEDDKYFGVLEEVGKKHKQFIFTDANHDQPIKEVVFEALSWNQDIDSLNFCIRKYCRLALLWENTSVLKSLIPVDRPENAFTQSHSSLDEITESLEKANEETDHSKLESHSSLDERSESLQKANEETKQDERTESLEKASEETDHSKLVSHSSLDERTGSIEEANEETDHSKLESHSSLDERTESLEKANEETNQDERTGSLERANEETNHSKNLEDLMVMALARGNAEFVRLLLSNYKIDMNNLFSSDAIWQLLYGYQYHQENFSRSIVDLEKDFECDMSKINDERVNEISRFLFESSSRKEFDDGKKCFLKISAINKLRNQFFENIDIEFAHKSKRKSIRALWSRERFSEEITLSTILLDLFAWAIISNLPDMAKMLWPFGEDQIAKALVASNFYRKLANQGVYSDYSVESIRNLEIKFSRFACELLDECYKINEIDTTMLITKGLSDVPGPTCLTLAMKSENHDFVAHPCVQKVLTDIWTGNIDHKKMEIQELTSLKGYLRILLGIILPFLIPILGFESSEDKKKPKRRKCQCHSACVKIYTFMSAPVVGFLKHSIAHVIFLCFYTHMILFDGRQQETPPSEVVLCVMAFGYLTTELYQISQYEGQRTMDKIMKWIRDVNCHNMWDLINLMLFLFAVLLKHCKTPDSLQTSHTLHSFSCACWILRLTTALRVYPEYGQYHEMIKLMFAKMMSLIIGVFFFVLAYGVFSTAILYPEGKMKMPERRFIFIFMRPWFHIYGEPFLDLKQDGNSTETSFGTKSGRQVDEYLVWFVLGFYLLVTNVILLNIVIAVFNNTYEEVMTKGIKIWKFNRYHVVLEYMQRYTLPTPFCIVIHVYAFFRKIMFCSCRNKCCCKAPVDGMDRRQNFDSKLKYDIRNLSMEEKVKLSQFQRDQALRIGKLAENGELFKEKCSCCVKGGQKY